jgi:hypothetical protein
MKETVSANGLKRDRVVIDRNIGRAAERELDAG